MGHYIITGLNFLAKIRGDIYFSGLNFLEKKKRGYHKFIRVGFPNQGSSYAFEFIF